MRLDPTGRAGTAKSLHSSTRACHAGAACDYMSMSHSSAAQDESMPGASYCAAFVAAPEQYCARTANLQSFSEREQVRLNAWQPRLGTHDGSTFIIQSSTPLLDHSFLPPGRAMSQERSCLSRTVQEQSKGFCYSADRSFICTLLQRSLALLKVVDMTEQGRALLALSSQ